VEDATAATRAMNEQAPEAEDLFTTETAGLSKASRSQMLRLHDGDQFGLNIKPVRKRIDNADVRMLGYNGSIPGPTLHVDQGSEITVQVTNDGDVEATVHWHGLRLENRFDGFRTRRKHPSLRPRSAVDMSGRTSNGRRGGPDGDGGGSGVRYAHRS
jgi:FtsP/CotA-like multicopper oxidase with cupredoxin domain